MKRPKLFLRHSVINFYKETLRDSGHVKTQTADCRLNNMKEFWLLFMTHEKAQCFYIGNQFLQRDPQR